MINKIISNYIVNGSLALAILMGVFVFTSKANAAEWPNILVGRDLALASTGQDVVVLQGLLSELGYLNVPTGIPFGYFGNMTKTALDRYQTDKGVSPATGYFGTLSKSSMSSDFANHGWLQVLGW